MIRSAAMIARRRLCRLLAAGGLTGTGCLAAPGFARAEPRPLVMIDPGHGGHDPGAIGVGDVMEKTITLATGFALRAALLRGGHRVAMTRTRDVFVSLPDRVAMAVRAEAELFISLHCNHLTDTAMRGALVFTLSRKPSDALAASIAHAENSYDRGPLSPRYRGVSPQVAGILASLTTHATMIGSKQIAHGIVGAFERHILLLPDPDRAADFAVLRDPLIPSTLIEMGCISNAADAALLRTQDYRALLAGRVALAANAWLGRGRLARIAG